MFVMIWVNLCEYALLHSSTFVHLLCDLASQNSENNTCLLFHMYLHTVKHSAGLTDYLLLDVKPQRKRSMAG